MPEHSSPGTPRGPQAHRYPGAPLSEGKQACVRGDVRSRSKPHALGSPLGSPRRAHRWVHRSHSPVGLAAGLAAQGLPLSSPSRLMPGSPHGLAVELTSGLTARARRWATSSIEAAPVWRCPWCVATSAVSLSLPPPPPCSPPPCSLRTPPTLPTWQKDTAVATEQCITAQFKPESKESTHCNVPQPIVVVTCVSWGTM